MRVWDMHTLGVARLVQAVSLGQGIVNVRLPVADGAAGVHAGGPLLDSAGGDAGNGQRRNDKGL